VPFRESGEGGEVVLGAKEHLFDLGELCPEHVGDRVQLVADGVLAGWAKTVRIVAATISAASLGITLKTLRRKCTRQRW
jgi:hypothetical protein